MIELIRTSFSEPVLMQGMLVVAAATAPVPVAVARAEVCHVAHDSIARTVSRILTRPTHYRLDALATTTSSSVDSPLDMQVAPTDHEWAEEVAIDPAWIAAARRLEEAGSFEDGWNGTGSVSADRTALSGTSALLKELQQHAIPGHLAPRVGLDSDGTPTLSWKRDELVGVLSVFDATSYAYYLERGDIIASNEQATLSEPIPQDLLDILNA